MKETITTTFNVAFHLRNSCEKDGQFPIYAQISQDCLLRASNYVENPC